MHPEAISEVLVFKTNIQHEDDLRRLSPFFDVDGRIRQWNVDRSDVDHVLRVETDQLSVSDVIFLVKRAGFECEELPD